MSFLGWIVVSMPFFSTFTNDSMTKIRVGRGIVTLKIPHRVYIYIWLFPKIGGKPLKSSILIRFGTMIFTIHFGGFPPIFGNTHIYIE